MRCTQVFREFPAWFSGILKLFITTPEKGAKPTVHLAVADELKGVTGKYFDKTAIKEIAPVANDDELAEKVWVETEKLLEGTR